MMKTTIKMMFAAVVVMLSACQKEDMKTPSNFPEDGVIRVTTNVEAPTTRAGMTDENISMFHIHIDNAANSAYSYYGRYQWNGSKWNCYADGGNTELTMLWQNSTQQVTVSALSIDGRSIPKSGYENGVGRSVQQDQSDEVSLKASDVLYMEPTVITPATDLVDGKLPITFKHLNSKVKLTVALGTELNTSPGTAESPIKDLKIKGTATEAGFSASTNSGFNIDPTPHDVTAYENKTAYTPGNGTTTKAVASYEVILVPQTVAANGFSVSFKIAGKDYTWTSPAEITLAKGTLYELNLTAGKDIVTLGGFTASEWTAGTGGNVETE